MKRDYNPAQLSLIDPDSAEALDLLTMHAKTFEAMTEKADLWHQCLCFGARDEATRQAMFAYEAWLTFAIFLDLEREAAS